MIAATLIRPGCHIPHPCPSCQQPTLYERRGRAICAGYNCGWTGNLPADVVVVGRDTHRAFARGQDGLS